MPPGAASTPPAASSPIPTRPARGWPTPPHWPGRCAARSSSPNRPARSCCDRDRSGAASRSVRCRSTRSSAPRRRSVGASTIFSSPLGPKDPAARFELVRERLDAVKREPALGAAGSLAGLLAALPTALLVTLTRSQARTIDFATSNLRGSPVDLYMGGARIAASFPMGPRTGCALNVTLLSYKGSLDLGLNLDPASVTDPPALLECLDESFAALLAN